MAGGERGRRGRERRRRRGRRWVEVGGGRGRGGRVEKGEVERRIGGRGEERGRVAEEGERGGGSERPRERKDEGWEERLKKKKKSILVS